ncbi:unnamed protein product, partial [Amoebophrya sp. A120]
SLTIRKPAPSVPDASAVVAGRSGTRRGLCPSVVPGREDRAAARGESVNHGRTPGRPSPREDDKPLENKPETASAENSVKARAPVLQPPNTAESSSLASRRRSIPQDLAESSAAKPPLAAGAPPTANQASVVRVKNGATSATNHEGAVGQNAMLGLHSDEPQRDHSVEDAADDIVGVGTEGDLQGAAPELEEPSQRKPACSQLVAPVLHDTGGPGLQMSERGKGNEQKSVMNVATRQSMRIPVLCNREGAAMLREQPKTSDVSSKVTTTSAANLETPGLAAAGMSDPIAIASAKPAELRQGSTPGGEVSLVVTGSKGTGKGNLVSRNLLGGASACTSDAKGGGKKSSIVAARQAAAASAIAAKMNPGAKGPQFPPGKEVGKAGLNKNSVPQESRDNRRQLFEADGVGNADPAAASASVNRPGPVDGG